MPETTAVPQPSPAAASNTVRPPDDRALIGAIAEMDAATLAERWPTLAIRVESGTLELASALFARAAALRSSAALESFASWLLDPASPIGAPLVDALEGWDAPELIAPYAALLAEPLFPRRYQVARNLSRYRTPAAAMLLAGATGDRDPAIRAAAVAALAAFPSVAHCGLARTLLSDSRAEVQVAAARTLAAMAGPAALPDLAAALERQGGKPSPELAREIASLFGRLGSPQDTAPLLDLLGSPSVHVVLASLASLADLGAAVPAAVLAGPAAHPHWQVRAAAVSLAAASGLDESLDLLRAALSDAHRDVRRSAIEALGVFADDRVQELLAIALEDRTIANRLFAIEQLATTRSDQAIRRIQPLLSDPEAAIRLAAVDALLELSAGPSPEKLEALLTDGDPRVRAKAASLLPPRRAEEAGVDGALAAEHSGDAAEAVATLTAAVQRDPRDADALFHLGRLLAAGGEASAARRRLEVARELRPDHPATLRELAALHLRAGELDDAMPLLTRVRELRPSDAWALREQARVHAGRGRWADAVEALEPYLLQQLDDREAHLDLGRACLELGQRGRARAELDAMSRRAPLEPSARALIGEIELLDGQVDLAIEHLRSARDGGHASPRARILLGRALLQRGDSAEALQTLAGLGGSGPEAVLEARALQAQGDCRAALARVQAARSARPHDAEAIALEADLLETLGDGPGTLSACLALAQLPAATPGLPLRIGRLQASCGQPKAALATLHAHLDRCPEDAEALRAAAELESASGHSARALELYVRSVDSDPSNESAYLAISRIWLSNERPRRALGAAKRAASLAPSDPAIALAVAEAELAAGDIESARTGYHRALELGTASPLADRRLSRIYAARGQVERVLVHGARAWLAFSEDGALARELAAAHRASGQAREARGFLGKALAIDEADAASLEALADLDLAEGRLDEAAERSECAMSLERNCHFAQRVLGLALARLGHADRALPHLARWLGDHADDAEVRIALARAHAARGADREVQALYPEAHALPAAEETLGLLVARSALRLGDTRWARAIAENFVAKDCESLELLELAAEAMAAGGDREAAVAILGTACRRYPEAVGPIAGLARLHAAAGRFFEARRDMARARTMAPELSGLLLEAAQIEISDRRASDAVAHLEAYLRAVPRDPRGHLMRGQVHLMLGQPQPAEECFRRSLSADPKQLDACLALGRLMLRQGRSAEARRMLEAFASQAARRDEVLADLASVYVAEGRPREAEAYLRELVETGAGGAAGRRPLAQLLLSQKRDREALDVMEGAGEEGAALVLAEAESLRTGGDVRRARMYFERAVELGGSRETAILGAARCHLAAGEIALGRTKLEQLVALAPSSRQAAFELARLLAASNGVDRTGEANGAELDRAIDLIARFWDECQTDVAALNLFAALAIRRGRHTEAGQALARSVEVDGKQAEAHSLMGDVQFAAGQPVAALESYLKALALDGGLEEPACKAIAFMEASGNLVQGRAIMERVVEKRPKSRRARLTLARICSRLGEPKAASIHWEAAARDGGLGADDMAGLASAYVGMRRFGDAERINAAQLTADPRALEPLLLAGDIARAAGRMAEARVRYDQAAQLHPGDARCPARLADLYRGDGRLQDALVATRKALEIEPRNPAFALLHGRLLAELGRHEAARDTLVRLLEKAGPHEAETRLILSRVHRALDDRRSAAKTLEELVDGGGASDEARRELAALSFERGDWPRAGELYEQLRASHAGLDLAEQERMALCYARMGMCAKGAGVLREIAARGKTNVEVVLETARAYVRQGSVRDALSLLREQVGKQEASPRARLHLEIARLEHRAGDRKASEQNLLAALRLRPEDVDAQAEVALFLEETNQFQTMLQTFADIVRRYPNDARAQAHLGHACIRLGHGREAREAYARSVELDYNFAGAHAGLGLACRMQGELAAAAEELRKALFLAPRNGRVCFDLGVVLAESGQTSLAATQFEKVLDLEPQNSPVAIAAREQLRKLTRPPARPPSRPARRAS